MVMTDIVILLCDAKLMMIIHHFYDSCNWTVGNGAGIFVGMPCGVTRV